MKKHPKHAVPEATVEDDAALDPVDGIDDIDAGEDLTAGEDADLEIDASLDDVAGADGGETADELEVAEGLEEADAGLEDADGEAIAEDAEAADDLGDMEDEEDAEDASGRRGSDTGECPPIANNDTPLATIEEPPVISAAHPGEAPMVEVADGHGGSVTLCQVLPLEYLENKEDFPNLFPPRPKPGALRRTTSARSGRRGQDVELTPEQLEMRRKQDARAKLIIYGGLALVTLAFLVLLSARLHVLAAYCGKKMDPIWPWSLVWPPEPQEGEEAPAPAANAKDAKKKAPKPASANADATAETTESSSDDDAGEKSGDDDAGSEDGGAKGQDKAGDDDAKKKDAEPSEDEW